MEQHGKAVIAERHKHSASFGILFLPCSLSSLLCLSFAPSPFGSDMCPCPACAVQMGGMWKAALLQRIFPSHKRLSRNPGGSETGDGNDQGQRETPSLQEIGKIGAVPYRGDEYDDNRIQTNA